MYNMKRDYHVKKCMILAHGKFTVHTVGQHIYCQKIVKNTGTSVQNYNTYKAMKSSDLISLKNKNL